MYSQMVIIGDTLLFVLRKERTTINFQAPAEVRAALERAAESEQRSISFIAVEALVEWLISKGFLRKDFKKPKPWSRS
jgi:hypothetical protein